MDNKLQDELKSLVRRVDTLQKTVELLYADRNILEDILSRMSSVEHALNLNKEHQTEMQKSVKQEIREAGAIVENTVHDIKDTINGKTIVVKSHTEHMLSKIMKKLLNTT